MRLQALSDLHNEFSNYTWNIPVTNCDLIILAGDIGNGLRGVTWAIDQSTKLGKHLFYIFGNHEYYGCDLSLLDSAKELAKDTLVSILENRAVSYTVGNETLRFICTTLWTDYLLYGPTHQAAVMEASNQFMADRQYIRNINSSQFSAADALALHKKAVRFLTEELNKSTKDKVVITHHQPSAWGVSSEYRGDILSPSFASDLEDLIIQTKPLAWIAGHSHYNYQRKVGDTILLANQKGYPKEGLLHFDPNLILELELNG